MTTENLKNPTVVAVPDPIDLDLAIESIQNRLASIPWMQKSFGRAREIPRKTVDGKTTERVPMIYQGGGEYYPAVPNDSLSAFSFFMAGQPRQLIDHKPLNPSQIVSSPLALIVWGNLNKIDKTRDYVFTELLLNNVITELNRVSTLEIGRVFDENVREIWRGLTINDTHLGLLMYPYFSFRVEFMIRFQMICPSPVVM